MKLVTVLTLSFVVFLWGSSFTALKLGLEEIPPITLAFLRFLIALPLLTAITYSRKRHAIGGNIVKDWKTFSVLGLTGVTLFQAFQNFGLRFTTASNSSLIISANPVFIALLDHFYLKERMTLRRIFGVAVAFFGVIIIVRPLEWSLHLMGVVGDLLSLDAALCWAFYSILGRNVLSKYDADEVTTFSMILGTLFMLPIVLTFEKPVLPTHAWIWFLLLFLSLLCSGLAYLFWSKALEDVSATQAGVFLFFIPAVSVSIAHIVLLEPLDLFFAIGALLVTIGVAITER